MDEQQKRLHIVAPTQLHNEIKAHAALRNIPMRKYILQAIIEKIMREKSAANSE